MRVAVSQLTMGKPELFKKVMAEFCNSDVMTDNYVKVFCHENCTTGYAKRILDELNIINYVSESTSNDGVTIPRIKLMDEILKEDFDVFIEIHDDMIFVKNWFKDIVELFNVNPNYHVLMPMVVMIDSMDQTPEDIEQKIKTQNLDTSIIVENHIQMHPWIIDIPFIRKYGYYDNKFVPAGAEDDDYLFSSIKNGSIPVASYKSRVGHKYGFTRNTSGMLYCEYNKIFQEKHGMTIQQFKDKYITNKMVKI